jgi:predicted nucleic acid-binding Zn ribbon protein
MNPIKMHNQLFWSLIILICVTVVNSLVIESKLDQIIKKNHCWVCGSPERKR